MKKEIRQVVRSGKTLAFNIPSKWIREKNLKFGDKVLLDPACIKKLKVKYEEVKETSSQAKLPSQEDKSET